MNNEPDVTICWSDGEVLRLRARHTHWRSLRPLAETAGYKKNNPPPLEPAAIDEQDLADLFK